MKRKEQIVTSAVMCIVSIMVIIGFTVAWYITGGAADISGVSLNAAEQGDIRIALYSVNDTSAESEGKRGVDISELTGDDQYVVIGLEELNNIGFTETDSAGNTTVVYKIAPGAYGDVTFYVTPLKSSAVSCSVTAEVLLKDLMGENGTLFTKDNGEVTLGGETVNVYDLAQEHIVFYYYKDTDTAKADPVLLDPDADGSDPSRVPAAVYPLTWDAAAEEGVEREVKLYWKWYYESPEFESALAEQTAGLGETAAVQKERELRRTYQTQINEYDKEDTAIGNYIESMQFHFAFSVP